MPTAEQVVPCRAPLRSFEWAGMTRPVHEGIVGDLEWIRHQWLLRGGQAWYPIRSWWGYHPRDCKSGGHPRAVALDVNPAENPMTAKRTPCISDQPRDFIDLFKARGFGWGGEWRSKCDAMHFSKLGYEGGNGRLYVPAGSLSSTPPPALPVPVMPPIPGATAMAEKFVYDASFLGGVSVAMADVDGDGVDEIITGAEEGGGPHVRVWKLDPAAEGGLREIGAFMAFDSNMQGGINVAGGVGKISVTPMNGGPHLRVFDWPEVLGG